MDDLAKEVGISKKTIYAHFANKTELVAASTMYLFETINEGISKIVNKALNPIAELIRIKEFAMELLKNEQSSPLYQLQTYYPTIHDKLKSKQLEIVESCISNNIERGIASGLYRKEINTDFISRIYFSGITGIKDLELFPASLFKPHKLIELFLSYHFRAICTTKGLKTYTSLIKQKTNQ